MQNKTHCRLPSLRPECLLSPERVLWTEVTAMVIFAVLKVSESFGSFPRMP